MSVQDNIVFILEIIGTVAFAVSGALVGSPPWAEELFGTWW